jgi:hypothetical protein
MSDTARTRSGGIPTICVRMPSSRTPVAGPQNVHVTGRADRGHHVMHNAEDLDVGVRAVGAEDVHVDLPVLANPAAL